MNMGECEAAELQSGDSRQSLQMTWAVAVSFVASCTPGVIRIHNPALTSRPPAASAMDGVKPGFSQVKNDVAMFASLFQGELPQHLRDIPSWKPSAVMWISKQSLTWWVNYSVMTLRLRDKKTDQTNFHSPTDLVNNCDPSFLSSKGQNPEALDKPSLANWVILGVILGVLAVVAATVAVVLVRRRRGNYIIEKTF